MLWIKGEPLLVVTPEELARMASGKSPPVIVDVHDPQSFRDGHLSGAINTPLNEWRLRSGELDPAAPTVFY